MGIQDKNTKTSIKSKSYPKRETLRELKNLTLIDWYSYKAKCVTCSGRKSTSEKKSVDSIQDQPTQLTIKLSLIRLIKGMINDSFQLNFLHSYHQAIFSSTDTFLSKLIFCLEY